MCGRYTLTTELADWTEYSGYSVPETGYGPRYNIAPGQYAPVVVNGDGDGVTRIMKWGLIPFWAKDEKIAYKTINARSETLDERASFKHALKKRRCLVPADGFYEWQKTAGGKVPHYIYLRDRRAFARLFLPYTAGEMIAHPVDPDVGNVKNDRPDLIEPSGQLSL